MFEAIVERRKRRLRTAGAPGTIGSGIQRVADVPPAPAPTVLGTERARRLFGDVAPLPPESSEVRPPDLGPLLAILSFPPPDPDHPLFERVAGPGVASREPRRRPRPPAPVLAPVTGVAPPTFDALLRHDLGARAGRRAAWTGLGAAVQATLVVSAIVLASAAAAPEVEEIQMVVPVHLPAATARRATGPPGLPAAPAAPAPRRRTAAGAKPRRTIPSPPPSALLQPREVQAAVRPPDPDEPIEDVGEDGGDGEPADGVVGGVIGGVPGGSGGGAWGAGASRLVTAVARQEEIVDAPIYATAGFRKPVELDPGCVRRAIRLPRELAGFTSGPITVRLAVGGDGAVGRVELLSPVPDARIEHAIEQAIRSCRWRGGADATGRPVAIWVILPIRFEGA